MTRKPWEPTPMKAMLTLSLGGTYPAPPSTRRGTIEKPIAAAVVCPRNLRREIKLPGKLRERRRFFTVPPAAPTAYCKRTRDLLARKFAIPRLAAHCRRMTGKQAVIGSSVGIVSTNALVITDRSLTRSRLERSRPAADATREVNGAMVAC